VVGVLLSGPWLPFSLALGLLVGLLALELAALALGASLLAAGDGPDVGPDLPHQPAGADASFDLSPGTEPDIDRLLTAAEQAHAGLGRHDLAQDAGPLGLLGLGRAPFGIWLAAAALGYGLSGYALQGVAQAMLGAPLGPWVAGLVALLPGAYFARRFADAFARAIPRVETSATRAQFMGGLRGVVSQGTARAGQPAEVRVRDRHGNLHFVRCEPFDRAESITEGTDVLTVRERRGPNDYHLRIVAVGSDPVPERTIS
jgi:hypothetical protein